MVLPFGFKEFNAIDWQNMPNIISFDVFFIVVFSTFLTYLLNLISMKRLTPTAVAVFIYLQPLFATIFAISLGKDQLNLIKIISAVLIFVGVFLVVRTKKGRRTIMFSLSESVSTNSNPRSSLSKTQSSISSLESVHSFNLTPPHNMNCTINRLYQVCSTREWLQWTPLLTPSLNNTCLRL